jgi:hypothetical protein
MQSPGKTLNECEAKEDESKNPETHKRTTGNIHHLVGMPKLALEKKLHLICCSSLVCHLQEIIENRGLPLSHHPGGCLGLFSFLASWGLGLGRCVSNETTL